MTRLRPLPASRPHPQDWGQVVGESWVTDPVIRAIHSTPWGVTVVNLDRMCVVAHGSGEQLVFRRLRRSRRWCLCGRSGDPALPVLKDMALERGAALEMEIVGTWFRFAFRDQRNQVCNVFEVEDLHQGLDLARTGLERGAYDPAPEE